MLNLRIFRSPAAKYYQDDVLHGPAAYPDVYFERLVEHGFNAVWLRGILRHLAASAVFPELSEEVARHQDALGTVVARARQHGVGVFLYLNEPLCVPADHAFWQAHPELRGAMEEPTADAWCMDPWPRVFALCTSMPAVRDWLREAAATLFRDVPELAGWFAITASEHMTHCWSHGAAKAAPPKGCPRCTARDPLDLVLEVLTALHDGTKAAKPAATTIAWNWSWNMFAPDPQPTLIERLPRGLALLLDWERGGTFKMPSGKPNFIDEYSLSYVGPSERFRLGRDEARRRGVPVLAKLQVGTTHELATVPNLPLIDHLYEKLRGCEEMGLEGILGTWNFGNMFSLNTAAVGQFVRQNDRPEPDEFVAQLARSYFPGADPAGVARAVRQFSAAMAYFPFDMALLYNGVANYALAYPLTAAPLTGKSMGATWMMHPRGDDLSRSLGQFTLEEVIDLLATMVTHWNRGVGLLESALAGCRHAHAAEELGVARTIGCCFRSTRNAYSTYKLRLERPPDLPARFREVATDEIANLETALPLLEADPRLGFHAECQGVQFSAELVREKLAQLRASLAG